MYKLTVRYFNVIADTMPIERKYVETVNFQTVADIMGELHKRGIWIIEVESDKGDILAESDEFGIETYNETLLAL